MDQVTVPQFIENEDKILGPLTVRQFVILFIAALIIFIAYKTSDFMLFLAIAVVVATIAGILGFYKVNGRPFHYFLLHIIETMQRPALRIWKRKTTEEALTLHWGSKKEEGEEVLGKAKKIPPSHAELPRSRLAELALIVDTGGAYRGEEEEHGAIE